METKIFKTDIPLKKLKMIVFLLYVLIGNMAFSCVEEKDSINNVCAEPYETVKTLNDATGTIGFDEINKQYIINIYVEGTIDEIITLYPCELAEEFKKVNLKIKIDGRLFKNDKLPKPQIGGQEMFYIDITKVTKLNN